MEYRKPQVHGDHGERGIFFKSSFLILLSQNVRFNDHMSILTFLVTNEIRLEQGM